MHFLRCENLRWLLCRGRLRRQRQAVAPTGQKQLLTGGVPKGWQADVVIRQCERLAVDDARACSRPRWDAAELQPGDSRSHWGGGRGQSGEDH